VTLFSLLWQSSAYSKVFVNRLLFLDALNLTAFKTIDGKTGRWKQKKMGFCGRVLHDAEGKAL